MILQKSLFYADADDTDTVMHFFHLRKIERSKENQKNCNTKSFVTL